MAVPKYDEIMPEFIRCLGDGQQHDIKEIRTFCSKAFKLSESDLQQTLPSGNNMFYDRVSWAKTYLKKAGLIESPSRTFYQLTADGKTAFSNGVEKITVSYLQSFEAFNEFFGKKPNKNATKLSETEPEVKPAEPISPIENIENAISALNQHLGDDLMTEIMKMSPYEFETLVVKLLVKMGYGNSQSVGNFVTKKSGDEGIDGVVTQDKLGFDSIYLQAKQWKRSSPIGRPEIQKFLGALAGQGADKGLFITTSRFSAEATAYVNKQLNHKIILIDGDMLTQLMIEYNLGVFVHKTYEVKRIDLDFFSDDI